MKLVPIVEGKGDVEAVPLLLRRFASEYAVSIPIEIDSALRMKRSQIAKQDSIQRMVRLAKRRGVDGIMILFDSDDDCPATLAAKITNWANEVAIGTPCVTIMAHREFEAWFLASIESLRNMRGIRVDAESHPYPERPRDAKRALKDRMVYGRGYSETTDQAAFAARFSMTDAYLKCRSFRKFVKAFGDLMDAAGEPLGEWPPPALTGRG